MINEPEFSQEIDHLIQSISQLIENNQNIQGIELYWSFDMDTVMESVEKLRNLKTLKLGCTHKPRNLFQILRNNKGISVLHVCEMPFTSIDSMEFYQSVLENGHNTNLKELKLDGLGFLPNLLPDGYFPNMEKLVIIPSRNAASILFSSTNNSLSTTFASMTTLKSVIMPIIMDELLMVLARFCLQLEELDVVDGRYISNQGLLCLNNLPHLKRLALGCASLVTDDSLLSIIENKGNNLTRISLPFNNQNISPAIIGHLRKYCPRLEAITNLPAQITFEELQEFASSMNNLVILGRCIGGSRAFSPLGYLNKMQIDSIKKNAKWLAHIIQNG